MRIEIIVRGFALERFGKFLADFFQVGGRGDCAGNDAILKILLRLRRTLLAEDHALDIFRPAASRPAEATTHHVRHGFWKTLRAGFKVHDVSGA